MSAHGRRAAFAAVCAVAVIGIAAVVVSAVRNRSTSSAGVEPTVAIREGDLLIVDQDRTRNAANFGRLALLPAGAGPRRVTSLRCERVAFASGAGICLALKRSFPARSYSARFFDARQRVHGEASLAGTPSRARVSPGGRYAASTTFVGGDAYTNPGAFSTRTVIYDVRRAKPIADLEKLRVTRDGQRLSSPDFNYWGVTFDGDSGRFYATLGTGSHHYLIHGDIETLRAEVIRDGIECPSLSPDGTRIVFKARVGDPFEWRLHVLDLRTGRETELPTDRSIDDQGEWLDESHVAYGHDEVTVVVDADGRSQPRQLVPAATSPGVAR